VILGLLPTKFQLNLVVKTKPLSIWKDFLGGIKDLKTDLEKWDTIQKASGLRLKLLAARVHVNKGSFMGFSGRR